MPAQITSALQRLLAAIREFTIAQRTLALLCVAVLVLGAVALSAWLAQPKYSPLFSGLAGEDASAIVDRYPSLFPHQREGIHFLARSRGAILADDMGLGKTRQSVIGLHERRPKGEFLVVCPASLKLNWEREIRLVFPDADVRIVNGPDAVVPARWTVINYDLLGKRLPELKRLAWRGLVFDEAHRYGREFPGLMKVIGRGARQGRKANVVTVVLTYTYDDFEGIHDITSTAVFERVASIPATARVSRPPVLIRRTWRPRAAHRASTRAPASV